jgi:hypothetical protein
MNCTHCTDVGEDDPRLRGRNRILCGDCMQSLEFVPASSTDASPDFIDEAADDAGHGARCEQCGITAEGGVQP